MELKEEKLKELKEIRRGFGILLLAILTFSGTILPKYVDTHDFLLKQILFFSSFSIVILITGIIIISIKIWRLIKLDR